MSLNVSTLAGLAGTPYSSGDPNGTTSSARFGNPRGMAVDSVGNIYVADYNLHLIRKITPAGVVTTFAGTGLEQTSAGFENPHGIAVDQFDNVYVADGQHTIKKITSAGVITTLAGSYALSGSTNGTGSAARFNGPEGVAVDAGGNVYVTDTGNNTIRKITPAGVVTTIAGTAGTTGSADGTGSAARFNAPSGIVMNDLGTVFLYVTDNGYGQIRKVTSAGVVTTFVGFYGAAGYQNGTGAGPGNAYFQTGGLSGIAIDASGNLYIADTGNNVIRMATSAGVVTTAAGALPDAAPVGTGGGPSPIGSTDGTGSSARFYGPRGLAINGSGTFYIADTLNYTIRSAVQSSGIPTSLTYSQNPAVYTAGTAITNNTPTSGGGAVVSYSVSPALPSGLILDIATGVISGTPATLTAIANYVITATNSSGSTTASLSITIGDMVATLSTATAISAELSSSFDFAAAVPTATSINAYLQIAPKVNLLARVAGTTRIVATTASGLACRSSVDGQSTISANLAGPTGIGGELSLKGRYSGTLIKLYSMPARLNMSSSLQVDDNLFRINPFRVEASTFTATSITANLGYAKVELAATLGGATTLAASVARLTLLGTSDLRQASIFEAGKASSGTIGGLGQRWIKRSDLQNNDLTTSVEWVEGSPPQLD